jgi:predicted nucleic acid-binding Zn ribbon protein
MSTVEKAEFEYVCPVCGETLEVNGSMKAVLIEKGCVICGAAVTSDAFTELA